MHRSWGQNSSLCFPTESWSSTPYFVFALCIKETALQLNLIYPWWVFFLSLSTPMYLFGLIFPAKMPSLSWSGFHLKTSVDMTETDLDSASPLMSHIALNRLLWFKANDTFEIFQTWLYKLLFYGVNFEHLISSQRLWKDVLVCQNKHLKLMLTWY